MLIQHAVENEIKPVTSAAATDSETSVHEKHSFFELLEFPKGCFKGENGADSDLLKLKLHQWADAYILVHSLEFDDSVNELELNQFLIVHKESVQKESKKNNNVEKPLVALIGCRLDSLEKEYNSEDYKSPILVEKKQKTGHNISLRLKNLKQNFKKENFRGSMTSLSSMSGSTGWFFDCATPCEANCTWKNTLLRLENSTIRSAVTAAVQNYQFFYKKMNLWVKKLKITEIFRNFGNLLTSGSHF